MWLVDVKPVTLFLIMVYMFLTVIISNNLLLAVVCGDYNAILEARFEADAKLRCDMLDRAYEILRGPDPTIPLELMIEVLRECDGDAGLHLEFEDGDFHELVVRMVDNKTMDESEEGADAEHTASKQDGQVDRDDLHELLVFFNLPLTIKGVTKPSHRYWLAEKMTHRRIHEAISDCTVDKLQERMQFMHDVSVDKWCASFPKMYYYMFEWGSGCEGMPHSVNPWQQDSIPVMAHTLWLTVYLVYTVFTSMDSEVADTYMILLLVSALMQSCFTLASFISEMRDWQPWHFFNIRTRKAFANWTNAILCLCLWWEFFSRCSHGGCWNNQLKASCTKLTLVASTVAKVMQILNFMVETPDIHILVRATLVCFEYLGPHLGLFVAVYYAFASMGIAMFCGTLTQSVATGGPGQWKGGWLTPATGTPANQTMYGGNQPYYNLNYNGLPQAIASLYAVMIQNNWNVNANGPIEITSRSMRWFFIVYTLIVAFVMNNILVGAIMDALSAANDALEKEREGDRDPLEKMVDARLHTTFGPSGQLYSDVWEIGTIPLSGVVRYDAAHIPAWEKHLGEPELLELELKHAVLDTEIDQLSKEVASVRGSIQKRQGNNGILGREPQKKVRDKKKGASAGSVQLQEGKQGVVIA